MMKNLLRCFWLLLISGSALFGMAQQGNMFPSQGQTDHGLLRTSASQITSQQSLRPASASRVINAQSGTGYSPLGTTTATCGPDTLLYPLAKTNGFPILNFSDTVAVGQWYDAPQSVTISGFSFFAFVDSATSQTVPLVCNVFAAGADSLPVGGPLATTVVTIDSNFFGGSVALLEKHATFPTAITVTGPFVVTVTNNSPITVGTLSNDYTATPADGLGEQLSSVFINGGWLDASLLTLGGNVFDADFLIHPHVTYQLTAAYQPNPAFACTNTPATVLNQSSPVVQNPFYNQAAFQGASQFSFTWDYGDGTPRVNSIDVNHTYTVPGAYTLTLIDTIFGWRTTCIDSTSGPISVSNGIGANAAFTSTPAGLTVSFTDQTTGGPVAWQWDFGDGNISNLQNPTHTYSSAGTYTVCLVSGNLCGPDTTCQTITVGSGGCPNPVALFTQTTAGNSVSFTDQSTSTFGITGYLWDFGDGNTSTMMSPTHTYAAAGTYTACLVVTDSCGSDSICSTLTIACPLPVSGFSSATAGLTVNFTDGSTNSPTAWAWDFGDGTTSTLQNPSHTYTTADTFLVCLIATNACGADTFCQNVITGCTTPTAAFTQTNTGLSFVFTDGSTGAATAWLWDFGDGNTSTMQNPMHTYSSPGTYTVCLTAINACGSNIICQPVNAICPTPTSAYSFTTNQLTATFTDGTTGGPLGWFWDFGDGGTSTLQNPSHTYAVGGTYTVCLVTVNSCGADTLCQQVNVVCPVPVASFGFSSNNLNYIFNDLSSGATSWFWDFGDGGTSTVQNPTHVYNNLGTFNVCLVASNACGADTFCQAITVTCPQPVPMFTSIANQLSVDFTDMSTGATGWQWDFGDGSGFSIQQNPSYTYALPGTYNVCLTAVNACGSVTQCSTVTVSCAPPAAAFTFLTVGNVVDFTEQSPLTTTNFFWDFGDGSTSTAQNPSHIYGSVGTYTVCLISSNVCGADTSCQQVIINCVPPTAGFSFSVSSDSVATFTNQASANTNSVSWTFGDGNSSTQLNPTHVYQAPGTYTVCQIVSNTCGLDTTCQTVTITCQNPTAGFTTQVTNATAVFTDVSILPGTYFWDFGDGTSSTDSNPTHVFPASGTYQVCLTVTNFCGSNTSCQNLVISCQAPDVNFSFFNAVNQVDFTDQSTNSPTSWLWNFGDGATDTVQNPSHGYLFTGQFFVCLRAGNECGSSDTCFFITVTTVGQEEAMAIERSFSVFPNPNNGQFQLEVDLPQAMDVRMRITNVLGQEIFREEAGTKYGLFRKSFDLSHLAAGPYMLELQADEHRVFRRIVID